MDKDTAEVFVIFLDAVIKFFDVRFLQKPQNAFLELAAPLARDDLYDRDFLFNRFIDHAPKLLIDLTASIKNIV